MPGQTKRAVWICDGCGKVSGAAKRLTMHKDWRDVLHPDALEELPENRCADDVIGREQFFCGVFVRHVVTRDDHLDPGRHDARRGQLTGKRYDYTEADFASLDAGIEVPF